MPKISAGLLMCRFREGELEFLLVHPGGPFFQNKDAGAWTIPKGETDPGEDPLAAAKREFEEELGFPPEGAFIALTPVQQKGGKIVHAWAFWGDCDPAHIRSNTFTTVVGYVKFGKGGEWAEPRVVQTQFQTVKGNDIEQFRNAASQVVLTPSGYASGTIIYPFEKAK